MGNLGYNQANLDGVSFDGADLTGATFHGASAVGASFKGARLRGATLTSLAGKGADFTNSDLTWADLSDADLSGAIFDDATLVDADLSRATIDSRTSFAGADLSGASLIPRDAFIPALARARSLTGVDFTEYESEGGPLSPHHLERCRELGALGLAGWPCPNCELFAAGSDYRDPDCPLCGGVGWLTTDPAIEAESRPLPCLWCGGDRAVGNDLPGFPSWPCQVCLGLGRMHVSDLDRQSIPVNKELYPQYEHATMVAAVEDLDLSNVRFDEPNFAGATFVRCRFSPGSLRGAQLWETVFRECDLRDQDFSNADFADVRFERCDLRGAIWAGVDVQEATFTGCPGSPPVPAA